MPLPPDPQLSETMGTKITLTSNTGEGHNFFVHDIRRVTNFDAGVKGGSYFFSVTPPDNF